MESNQQLTGNKDDTSSDVSKDSIETQISTININSEEQKSSPGWNDPPNVSFDPINNQKRFKRPIYVSPNTALLSNTVKLSENIAVKPPILDIPTTPVLNLNLQSDNRITSEVYSEPSNDIKLEQILSNFNDILENSNKLNDKNILKRLKTMEDMWRDNRFSSSINSSLWKLSEAVRTKDIETAEKLHVALMTEFPGLCSSWMPAIRCIITLCSAQKE